MVVTVGTMNKRTTWNFPAKMAKKVAFVTPQFDHSTIFKNKSRYFLRFIFCKPLYVHEGFVQSWWSMVAKEWYHPRVSSLACQLQRAYRDSSWLGNWLLLSILTLLGAL